MFGLGNRSPHRTRAARRLRILVAAVAAFAFAMFPAAGPAEASGRPSLDATADGLWVPVTRP